MQIRKVKVCQDTTDFCILFIMLTTTCFGRCRPSSGHKILWPEDVVVSIINRIYKSVVSWRTYTFPIPVSFKFDVSKEYIKWRTARISTPSSKYTSEKLTKYSAERVISWIKGTDKIQAQILYPMQFIHKVGLYGSRNKRRFANAPELLHYAFILSLLSCILL
jgi:hypothetical protein